MERLTEIIKDTLETATIGTSIFAAGIIAWAAVTYAININYSCRDMCPDTKESILTTTIDKYSNSDDIIEKAMSTVGLYFAVGQDLGNDLYNFTHCRNCE